MRKAALITSGLIAVVLTGSITGISAATAPSDTSETAENSTAAAPAQVRLTISGNQFSNNGKVAAEVNVYADIPFKGTVQIVDAESGVTLNPLYESSGQSGENPTARFVATEPARGMASGRRSWSAIFTSGTEGVDHGQSAAASVDIYFWDSPPGSPFYEEVLWFGGKGYTKGLKDGSFDPTGLVSREAMAAFLYRMTNQPKTVPACRVSPYPDVPVKHQFAGKSAG